MSYPVLIAVPPYFVLVNTTGDRSNMKLAPALVRYASLVDINANLEFTVEVEDEKTGLKLTKSYNSNDVYGYPNPTWDEVSPKKEDKKNKKLF